MVRGFAQKVINKLPLLLAADADPWRVSESSLDKSAGWRVAKTV
ncbi:hypothetical protein E7V67_023335 [[Empedobacter] haloabium]|uniref:Uncharacterized protein n=1 Tax=[Empedobacter] haloabium TaxID=592317 RepID=A0ABZ1UIU4_9BURK